MDNIQLNPRELNRILVNLMRIDGLTDNDYIRELTEGIRNILSK